MKKVSEYVKNNKTFVTLFVFFIIYLLFKSRDDRIVYVDGEGINGDTILWYTIAVGWLLTIFLLLRKKRRLNKPLYVIIVELIFATPFGGYVFSVFAFLPVNYYNENVYAKKSDVKYTQCELLKITKSRKSKGMYIRFQGEKVFIRGFEPIFNEVGNNEDYIVDVSYKDGMLNSKIMRTWKVRKKAE